MIKIKINIVEYPQTQINQTTQKLKHSFFLYIDQILLRLHQNFEHLSAIVSFL